MKEIVYFILLYLGAAIGMMKGIHTSGYQEPTAIPEWREEMIKDAHLLADLFVPIQGEINKSSNQNLASAIVGFCLEVRLATLEEAAEAVGKGKVKHQHKNMCKIDSYTCEALQEEMLMVNTSIKVSQATIRSLKQ